MFYSLARGLDLMKNSSVEFRLQILMSSVQHPSRSPYSESAISPPGNEQHLPEVTKHFLVSAGCLSRDGNKL